MAKDAEDFFPAGLAALLGAELVARMGHSGGLSILGVPRDDVEAAFTGRFSRRDGPEEVPPDASGDESSPDDAVSLEEKLHKRVKQYMVDDDVVVQWDDVVGCVEAKRALQAAIEDPVRHASLHAAYGVRPDGGILLYGPSGNGKTHLARAAATALRRLHGSEHPSLLLINGSEIQTSRVGKTERIIRDVFAYAAAFRARFGHRFVVFLDEADALLPPRGTTREYWTTTTVGAFLTAMNGLRGNDSALVILATNRPGDIDPAILTDGRVGRRIPIGRPSQDDARAILEAGLQKYHATFTAAMAYRRGDDLVAAALPPPATLARKATERLWSPSLVIGSLSLGKMQPDGSAVPVQEGVPLHPFLSGAFLIGLIERAKVIAMGRDVASGEPPIGITHGDLSRAIDESTREYGPFVDRGEVTAYAQGRMASIGAEIDVAAGSAGGGKVTLN